MDKIVDYQIAFLNLGDSVVYREENEDAFKQYTKSLLDNGYQPYGPPVGTDNMFIQAFIKTKYMKEPEPVRRSMF